MGTNLEFQKITATEAKARLQTFDTLLAKHFANVFKNTWEEIFVSKPIADFGEWTLVSDVLNLCKIDLVFLHNPCKEKAQPHIEKCLVCGAKIPKNVIAAAELLEK